MNQLYYFIELTRLKRPIGYLLLFWPCIWGLVIGYDFSNDIKNFIKLGLFFLIGAILMRSAGCIVNDILDKEFDKKVERTKDRPLASGKISWKLALIYALALCLLAFIVLLNFNLFTIILALGSMPLAFTYPLMKRYTYWPQLFLGITFNYGLVLGWTSFTEQISLIPLLFYFGAIFWTLGYDTIYGYQDIKDDEIIGLKSTSIKFKKNSKLFLFLCYLTFILSFILGGYILKFNLMYFLFLIFPIIHLFGYQIRSFKPDSAEKCLTIFKSNNYFGLIVLSTILIGKLF